MEADALVLGAGPRGGLARARTLMGSVADASLAARKGQ